MFCLPVGKQEFRSFVLGIYLVLGISGFVIFLSVYIRYHPSESFSISIGRMRDSQVLRKDRHYSV